MAEDAVRLSAVGRIVRRRWRLLAVVAAAGALLGAGASLVLSPGYVASTTVLLQGQRDSAELATAAQIATSSVVLDNTAAGLGWGLSGSQLRDAVSSSVLDGNLIQISASADTPERAQQLAARTADEYIAFSTELASDTADVTAQGLREQRERLRQQIEATNTYITRLQDSVQGAPADAELLRTELEALRASLNQAITRLDEVEAAAGKANVVVVGPAERPTQRAAPTTLHFVAGGALLGLLLGVLGLLVAARADRRLRTEPEIAAALGAPVLASVDVPEDQAGGPSSTGGPRWSRLLFGDRPWDVPELPVTDDAGREVRYRRALARLRGRQHVRALVAQDDGVAHGAVARLCTTAEDVGGPPLHTVDVTAAHPAVPDGHRGVGVVVVLAIGSRTAWELVGIAEACADAGQPIVGAIVAYPSRPARRASRSQRGAPQEPADRGAMAGSA